MQKRKKINLTELNEFIYSEIILNCNLWTIGIYLLRDKVYVLAYKCFVYEKMKIKKTNIAAIVKGYLDTIDLYLAAKEELSNELGFFGFKEDFRNTDFDNKTQVRDAGSFPVFRFCDEVKENFSMKKYDINNRE